MIFSMFRSKPHRHAAVSFPLSVRCQSAIDCIFPSAEASVARELFANKCGENLPLLTGRFAEIERVQMAMLKLSEGNLGKLIDLVRDAQTDWRDILLAAFPVSDDALTWDPAISPFPRQICLPNGRMLAELLGLPGSASRQQFFQLRLAGCPLVRDRFFAAQWLLSPCGGFLALLEVGSPASTSDLPTVTAAVVVRLDRRIVSTARRALSGEVLTLIELTAKSLNVGLAPERETQMIPLASLAWSPLYQV